MATRTEVVLVDDLDGETPASTTVRFAFDQTEYELDLSGENAAAMCEAVCRYVAVARKVSSSSTEPPATDTTAVASGD